MILITVRWRSLSIEWRNLPDFEILSRVLDINRAREAKLGREQHHEKEEESDRWDENLWIRLYVYFVFLSFLYILTQLIIKVMILPDK